MLSTAAIAANTFGNSNQTEFLPVEQAFQLNTELVGQNIQASWTIAPGTYLYKTRISFDAEGAALGEVKFPTGDIKNDETFGRVEVYHDRLHLSVPLTQAKGPFTLNLSYQGCAEAGLCYPPVRVKLPFDYQGPELKAVDQPAVSTANPTSTTTAPVLLSESEQIANSLSDNKLLALLAFFGLGLGLALTPCVFPMIPILSSIILGQKDLTTRKAFSLSIAYTQGAAVTYAVLGLAVAYFGGYIQGFFQTPGMRIGMALIFVALSFAMFGFYELRLPSSWQEKLTNTSNNQQSGNLSGVFMMGVLSTLIVSPCISAPVSGALIYISQTGDQLFGALSLYLLGLGAGVPLILVGTFGTKALPKRGGWMDTVKYGFGVLMLGMALYMIEILVPAQVYLLLWGVMLVVCAVYLGAMNTNSQGIHRLWQGLGIVMLLLGSLYIYGAVQGGNSLLRPIPQVAQQSAAVEAHAKLNFQPVSSLQDLQAQLEQAKAAGKKVMLDFYADWCSACKEFDAITFEHQGVVDKLSDWVLLRADVTETNSINQEMMKAFKVQGLPSLAFFTAQGDEPARSRIAGFTRPEPFIQHLQGVESISNAN